MDILKQELLRKRQSLAQDVGGRKVFKRSEIEQKRIQRLREEEKRESEAKALKQQQQQQHQQNQQDPQHDSSNPNSTSQTSKQNPDSAAASSSSSSSKKPPTNEQKIDDLNLSKQEVVRRLRLLKQPVTLFGEDDLARLVCI